MSERLVGELCRRFLNPQPSDPQTFSVERPVTNYNWTLISSDNVKFRVHSSALVSQSDYFAALCASGMSEQQNNLVEFPDIDSVSLERFLSYVCTGSVIVSGDSFKSLVQLGCRFQCQTLTDILRSYLELEFLSIKQSDLSEVFLTRIDPSMADICRRLIEENLISQRMLDLSFEVVADVLRRDELETWFEDEVLAFVNLYCERCGLDTHRRMMLLETIRQPRLTCAAFEKAALLFRGFSKTKSFQTIANSESHQYNFIDTVDEAQLRPRFGHGVHITMLWILQHKMDVDLSPDQPHGMLATVRSLFIEPGSGTRILTTDSRQSHDRKYLCEEDIFSSGAFVTFANHVFCLSQNAQLGKITFKRKQGPVLMPKPDLDVSTEYFAGVRRVIGVDVDQDEFYLSCRVRHDSCRIAVFKCCFDDNDVLKAERVELPVTAKKLSPKRMIYREDFICILTESSEIFVYSADTDALNEVPPADSSKPQYLQIARRDVRLYVFDYSECAAHLHDFSQPHSRFDKIRVYDLSQKKWVAHYEVEMNKLRESLHNELIGFNIEMYFIRGQLYFLWTHQGNLHIFRLDEKANRTEHLFNCEVPPGAKGVILLPGYLNLNDESTVLETFINSYCSQKMEFIGANREKARKLAEWGEKYLDGIVGSGLIPFEVYH